MLPSQPAGYELCFPIGSGGMATVSYGRRLSAGGFAHAVAIKQLHPHLASKPEIVSMFLDEARLAARVVHANVVSILDVVQQGHDVWAVMPYIEGESLSLLAKEAARSGERIPVAIAVALAVDLLAGLEAAHTATNERGEALGIVHRDVSPQNLLVGADGVARVLDFGVAKAHGRLHETRDGEVKGKLAYMAPEQLGGDASISSDVYAAAIVLWELLAGRSLFQGSNDMLVMMNVLAGAASAPSQHAPVPPELDAIVMRALSLEPARRYGSAAALAAALVDACSGAIAARTEVAAWVGRVASKAMAERRALACEAARRPVANPATLNEHDAVSPSERATRFGFVTTAVMPRTPTPITPVPPRRSGRRLWASAVALAVVGLLAVSARALVPSAAAENHHGARLEPSTPSPAAALPAAAMAETDGPAAETSERAVTSPSPASARVPAKAGPAKAPRSVSAPKASASVAATVAAAPAPAAAEDCDPPFVVDASGMRRYKRSCLR